MGCASSKTAEDKADENKHPNRKSTKSSPSSSSLSGLHSNPSRQQQHNGKSPHISGSTNNYQTNSIKQHQQLNNNNNNNNNNNINGSNNTTNGRDPNAQAALIESNNFILLTEFFKAVGNGELDKLKQILLNVEEINNSLKKQQQQLNNKSNSKLNTAGTTASPPISMSKQELLNAGMTDADGLTALSIAAGRKHKALTEYLADLPGVDVNKASESGITPLLMVAEVGWTDVMKQLLKRGAHVDAAPKGYFIFMFISYSSISI
jgi:hypothetical protein